MVIYLQETQLPAGFKLTCPTNPSCQSFLNHHHQHGSTQPLLSNLAGRRRRWAADANRAAGLQLGRNKGQHRPESPVRLPERDDNRPEAPRLAGSLQQRAPVHDDPGGHRERSDLGVPRGLGDQHLVAARHLVFRHADDRERARGHAERDRRVRPAVRRPRRRDLGRQRGPLPPLGIRHQERGRARTGAGHHCAVRPRGPRGHPGHDPRRQARRARRRLERVRQREQQPRRRRDRLARHRPLHLLRIRQGQRHRQRDHALRLHLRRLPQRHRGQAALGDGDGAPRVGARARTVGRQRLERGAVLAGHWMRQALWAREHLVVHPERLQPCECREVCHYRGPQHDGQIQPHLCARQRSPCCHQPDFQGLLDLQYPNAVGVFCCCPGCFVRLVESVHVFLFNRST
ncbi:hypothetical protein CTA1_2553 [Colletotrichum tanaceti]|uniref:Uncharacterized protein n=1 Tax=Colletotrichum tanaceti TaxID=1306861 RepID=A0A4U6XC85_9PEZI|nr:hypothetical protein CTA1_2553 [Colletotrichum tanaceti]